MKKCLLTLLTVLLFISVLASEAALAENTTDLPGKPMPDFTVTTISGDRFTLSETLKTKKAVLINFWATWCNPCLSEFPYMEQAYQLYKDEIEIIALSVEENDTPEVLKDFAKEQELSFLIASDTEANISGLFVNEGIPTSVLVDRFGNIVLVEVGAQSRLDAFTNAFDLLISDAYVQTVTLNGFPGARPDIAAVSDEALLEAVGDPPFIVTSSNDPYAWPFLPVQSADRSALSASNAGHMSTFSEVLVQIDARTGDVFAFDALLNTQDYLEKFIVSLNGQKIRTFSGKTDWFTFAVKLEEGNNTVSLRYDKSIEYYMEEPNKNECVLLSAFRLLNSEEGAEALANNPVFSFADETTLTVINPESREVRITDSQGNDTLEQLYGQNTHSFIVNDILAHCIASISDEYDPDDIFIEENGTGMLFTAYTFQNKSLAIPLNNTQDTGLSSTLVLMYNTLDSRIANLVLFDYEDSVDEFCDRLKNRGMEADWSYIGDEDGINDANLPENVTYTVTFTDQYGAPVPNCIINFCTDQMCVPVKANENGVAVFVGSPFAYHLQVIVVPKGYSFDTKQEFTAPLLGGDLTFVVEKQ